MRLELYRMVGVWWFELEPHLSLFGAFSVLAYMRFQGHPFDLLIEILMLTIAGGPAARDAIIAVLKAWKGTT